MGIPLTLSQVPLETPYIQYVSSNGQTVFPYPFAITQDSDLIVVVNGVTLNTDSGYSLSGQGNPSGGNLTFTSGQTTGAIVTLFRDIPIERISQISQNSGFSSTVFNAEFNNIYLILQQLESSIGQCLQLPNTNNPAPATALTPANYANKYLTFDSNGNPQPGLLVSSGSLTEVILDSMLTAATPAVLAPLAQNTARTSSEISAGVTPTSYQYLPGDLRRYGGDPTGVADASTAWANAVKTGYVVIPQGCTFKVVTGTTFTGQITVQGFGKASKLRCDSTVLTVTGGDNSVLDNFWMENITTPYIITRNPANWSAALTPAQSNGLGYQPTVNDPEYATWVAGQPLVGTQNIGPTITFTRAASHIKVSRIYGRFVCISIFDAINSSVEDCDFQGGKGTFAAVLFDNCTNNVQQGANNKAINNRIYYASQCGITVIANDDFIFRGNHSFLNGQSGLQTAQTSGLLFTASVGGATSGTLTAPFTGPTASDYGMAFENGEVRTVTLTNGSTAVSWSPVLPAGNLVQVAAWGHSSLFNNSTRATISSRCQVVGNRTYQNYFDGLDFLSTFGTTNGAVRTYHQICDNHSYGNNGDGMNIDGQFGNVEGNTLYSNGRYGIWGVCQNTQIVGNANLDNNQLRNASVAEIQATGGPGNKIADNYMWGGSTQNCPAILTTGTALNYIMDNIVVGPAANNVGNTGSIAAVYEGNIDSVSGASTPQSFMLQIKNNGGTLQHIFYADLSAASAGLFDRINGATSGGFTNTPTGTDSSTAMVAGIKIGSGIANAIWLDTAAQPPSKSAMIATIIANSTGTALTLIPMLSAININGVTRTRLSFQIVNAATGAGFTLNTTNITAGKEIDIQFYGRLS